MAPSPLSTENWIRQLVGESDTPARKIKPSRYSVTGYVATEKASKSQEAESSLEQDFLTLLEYDRRVDRYLAQPFTLHWNDVEGKRRRYTPDVIVKYSYSAGLTSPYLRTTVYEVKPRKILSRDWAELRPKFKAAISWAREHNCKFHVVTEREIRTPYLTNARFLLQYRSRCLEDTSSIIGDQQSILKEQLFILGDSTPRDLLNAVTTDRTLQAKLIPTLWNLVHLQHIGVDLNKKLTMASRIWTLDEKLP